jgi:excisionase family DNA binding protein
MSGLAAALLAELGPDELAELADALAPLLADRLGSPPSGTAELLSVAEAARIARCHEETIRRAVRAGALVSARAGRAVRIDHHDLVEWLSRPVGRAQRPAQRRRGRPTGRNAMADAFKDLDRLRSER